MIIVLIIGREIKAVKMRVDFLIRSVQEVVIVISGVLEIRSFSMDAVMPVVNLQKPKRSHIQIDTY